MAPKPIHVNRVLSIQRAGAPHAEVHFHGARGCRPRPLCGRYMLETITIRTRRKIFSAASSTFFLITRLGPVYDTAPRARGPFVARLLVPDEEPVFARIRIYMSMHDKATGFHALNWQTKKKQQKIAEGLVSISGMRAVCREGSPGGCILCTTRARAVH